MQEWCVLYSKNPEETVITLYEEDKNLEKLMSKYYFLGFKKFILPYNSNADVQKFLKKINIKHWFAIYPSEAECFI